MGIIHLTSETYEEEVVKSDKPVLIDFWATWCGPCKMIEPALEEIAEERPDIKVCKVNVDQQPDLTAQYQVLSIPFLVILKDGEIVKKTMGAQPKASILKLIDEALR